MFKLKKAFLGIMILSTMTVQVTEPAGWGLSTAHALYNQGARLCSQLNKPETQKKLLAYAFQQINKANRRRGTIACLLSAASVVCGLYQISKQQKPVTCTKAEYDQHFAQLPVQLQPHIAAYADPANMRVYQTIRSYGYQVTGAPVMEEILKESLKTPQQLEAFVKCVAYQQLPQNERRAAEIEQSMQPYDAQADQTALNDQLRLEIQKIANEGRESTDWSAIRGLILCGADVNTATLKDPRDDDHLFGLTALHLAVSQRDVGMIRFLRNHHASMLQQDSNHIAAFDIAQRLDDAYPEKPTIIALLVNGARRA